MVLKKKKVMVVMKAMKKFINTEFFSIRINKRMRKILLCLSEIYFFFLSCTFTLMFSEFKAFTSHFHT